MPSFGIGGSSSRSSSYVDPKQQPYLDFLRNASQNVYQQFGQGAGQFAQQAGGQLFQQGLGYAQQATSNPFLQNLQAMSQPGGNQQLIGQQIGQLGADLGRNFQEQLLPGIRRDAIGLGGFGGTRQGVAEGIAAQGTQDAFARGATNIYGQNAQMAQQAGIAGGGLQAQGSLGAMMGLGGLFDVGMGQFTGGFSPLMSLSDIIGSPTVLDKSRAKSGNVGISPA
jgi:hypothetical protein